MNSIFHIILGLQFCSNSNLTLHLKLNPDTKVLQHYFECKFINIKSYLE